VPSRQLSLAPKLCPDNAAMSAGTAWRASSQNAIYMEKVFIYGLLSKISNVEWQEVNARYGKKCIKPGVK
jgi:hypothetical protein